MFEDWKQAWRQAVENFQRELRESDAGTPPRVRAMEREVASATGALAKLEAEIRQAQREAEKERESEAVCRRRGDLARNVGDDETVRIATEFAARHGERAALFERKSAVLEEERTLLSRDVGAMRSMLEETARRSAGAVSGGAGGNASSSTSPGADRPDVDERAFSRLENEARQRTADEMLEELKRRMRG